MEGRKIMEKRESKRIVSNLIEKRNTNKVGSRERGKEKENVARERLLIEILVSCKI